MARKFRNVRDRALLMLFLRLGLRTEEVANLVPADIDWKGGTLKIRSSKTCRDRILPLPREVGEALVAWRFRRQRTEAHTEERAARIAGGLLFALAGFVFLASGADLPGHSEAQTSCGNRTAVDCRVRHALVGTTEAPIVFHDFECSVES